jgi:membrane protein involved in colicin uptake
MAGSAVMAAVGMYTANKSSQEAKRARKDAERQAEMARQDALKSEQEAKKQQEEEARKLAESTPTGSMSTTSRIAAQKAIAMRRAGTGRAGTVLDKSVALG